MLQVFIWMLRMLAMAFRVFFFASFSNAFSSISSVFFCTLQVLHLDVSKINQDVGHVAMVFKCVSKIFYLF
jgi:hypothetical protein